LSWHLTGTAIREAASTRVLPSHTCARDQSPSHLREQRRDLPSDPLDLLRRSRRPLLVPWAPWRNVSGTARARRRSLTRRSFVGRRAADLDQRLQKRRFKVLPESLFRGFWMRGGLGSDTRACACGWIGSTERLRAPCRSSALPRQAARLRHGGQRPLRRGLQL